MCCDIHMKTMNWVLMAWCIRLTEARHYLRSGQIIDCQFNFVDTAWMFPITFTTIGYGDVYPKSPYGRLFAMWIGGSGIIASAILVGLTTDKLTMTRREKLINKVLYNENLRVLNFKLLSQSSKQKLRCLSNIKFFIFWV